jgi:hypothetical protein
MNQQNQGKQDKQQSQQDQAAGSSSRDGRSNKASDALQGSSSPRDDRKPGGDSDDRSNSRPQGGKTSR